MSPTLWLNGRLVPTAEARIDPSDRGLLLGDGLFETMRAALCRVPLLALHLDRLRRGAATLDMPCGLDEAFVMAACQELLAAEGLSEAALRLTLTRGPAPRGLLPPPAPSPTLMLAAFPLPPVPAPARMIIASITRRNERSPLAGVKALGYLDNILALREAKGQGADDAVLLNTAGRVACATTANLFIVEGHGIVTPPIAEGALPGITRGLVLAMAPTAGLTAREEPLTVERIRRADAMFTTSSLIGLRAVIDMDKLVIGSGRPHDVCTILQQAWTRQLRLT